MVRGKQLWKPWSYVGEVWRFCYFPWRDCCDARGLSAVVVTLSRTPLLRLWQLLCSLAVLFLFLHSPFSPNTLETNKPECELMILNIFASPLVPDQETSKWTNQLSKLKYFCWTGSSEICITSKKERISKFRCLIHSKNNYCVYCGH